MGLFEGFYSRAWVQLLCAILQGWLGGIIVKRFSTVVKNIAKSLSLILTVFSNEILFWECHDEPLSSTMYLLSISIFCSTVVFSQLGEDGARPQAKPAVSSVGPPGPGAPAVPLPAVSASEHQRKKSAFGPQSSGSGAPAPDPVPVPGGPWPRWPKTPLRRRRRRRFSPRGRRQEEAEDSAGPTPCPTSRASSRKVQ